MLRRASSPRVQHRSSASNSSLKTSRGPDRASPPTMSLTPPRMATRFFLATLSIITNQITNRNESIDLIRDFTPVALLESGAVILVVNPDSHLRNVAELVALAKSKPGEVLHATVIGSLPHLGKRTVRAARRRQAYASALSGQSADSHRRHRRPRADDVRTGVIGRRSDRGWQTQPARHRGEVNARARCLTCQPWRRPASPTLTPAYGSACSRPSARRGRLSKSSPPRPHKKRCVRRTQSRRCASRVTNHSMPARTSSQASCAARSLAGRKWRGPLD